MANEERRKQVESVVKNFKFGTSKTREENEKLLTQALLQGGAFPAPSISQVVSNN